MSFTVSSPGTSASGVGHRPRRRGSEKGCSPDRPKGLHLFRPGHIARVLGNFGHGGLGSMQNRCGHPASFSPTRSHTREPGQVPRRGHQCQQQLRPDRQVLGPIRPLAVAPHPRACHFWWQRNVYGLHWNPRNYGNAAISIQQHFASCALSQSRTQLNQSQGGMCICRRLGIGPRVLRECFGP